MTCAVVSSSPSVDSPVRGALPDQEPDAQPSGQLDPESRRGNDVDPRSSRVAPLATGLGSGGGPSSPGDHRSAAAASSDAGSLAPSRCVSGPAAHRARLAEVWHRTPTGKDGSYDVLAQWGEKTPYWAAMLHQAAIELRRGIAETELVKEMDEKVLGLMRSIKAMPLPGRRREATALCERLRSERSQHGHEQGATRLRRFIELLDPGGEDCNVHGTDEAARHR